MVKGNLHLSIDVNILEMVRIKRREDPTFSISDCVESFLHDFFETDLENLESRKLQSKKSQLRKELAIIQAQEEAMEQLEEKKKKDFEKKYGREVKTDESQL